MNNCVCNECFYMRLNNLEKFYLVMKNKMLEIIIFEEI